MTEGREIERQALMIEFEALKVEAAGQDWACRLDAEGHMAGAVYEAERKHKDIADKMRRIADQLREL